MKVYIVERIRLTKVIDNHKIVMNGYIGKVRKMII